MSENTALKVSCRTDLSPTTVFTQPAVPVHQTPVPPWPECGAGVYPGWVQWWVPGGVLYRVLTRSQSEASLRLISGIL